MLISFFQQNECLWNHNNPSYHENTHNKDILYDVLVKELNDKFNSEQVQKKWKEIEKKFKEEHSKASVRPSGSGTDEIYKPTFVFYDQLQFLTVICEGDETLDSIECQPDLNPRKKTKIQMQEERENRKLELFSQSVAAIREVPDLKKKAGNRSMEEDTEAVAFGTYVGITLSKLPRRKFRQAKKCIGDILYNIEESEDYTSSSNTSVHDNQFDRHSFVSTPNSFESSNSFTPLQNLTNERCGNNYHPAYQYQHSSSYN